jgi:methyl-accepting chemotaxis protein
VRRAEKDFLLRMDESYADKLQQEVSVTIERLEQLNQLVADEGSTRLIDGLAEQVSKYEENFNSLVAAFKQRGLDENSAAYGALRAATHELVVFRILCHFVKLSKKEMTYDQNQFRHGCRFKAVA